MMRVIVGSAEGVLFSAIDPDNADGSITDTLTVVGVRQGGLSSSSSVIGVNQIVSGSLWHTHGASGWQLQLFCR